MADGLGVGHVVARGERAGGEAMSAAEGLLEVGAA